MSASAERAAFATVGRRLIAASGDAGDRRAGGLAGRPDTAPPPTSFAVLLDAPDWLLRPAPDQVRLAEIVALRSLAPALARSIDGDWLGALAQAVGEDAVDWAIARGAAEPDDTAPAPVAPEILAARGFAILRLELPSAMHGYLAWAPAGAVGTAVPSIVSDALAFVAGRAA